jgi:phenylacetate-CoA ligase
MAFYASILRNFILPCVYFMRKERVSLYYKELLAIEGASVAEVLKYKSMKIEELLKYLIGNIKFYERFQNDFPQDSSQLFKLPVMPKNVIRENIELLTSGSCTHSYRSTSGTSGQPLTFTKDRKASSYMDAMMYKVYNWHGIEIGDKQARIWGTPVSLKGKLRQRIKDLLLNRRRLSVFCLNDNTCKNYFYTLKSFKPKYFYAYVNGLYQFALSVKKQGLDGKSLNIQIAICTGEVLFDFQKEKIVEVFGCKVVNEYGSTENGIIGFECEFGTMHLMPTVHLELLGGSDDEGEAIITELNSKSIPFVRYQIGDRVRWLSHHCACGRPYRAMEVIDGRVDSYIVCKNGDKVYDAILAYTLKSFALKFKAVQDVNGVLVVTMVPRTDLDKDYVNNIRHTLENHLGHDMEILIDVVADFPFEPSGKLRYFHSKSVE